MFFYTLYSIKCSVNEKEKSFPAFNLRSSLLSSEFRKIFYFKTFWSGSPLFWWWDGWTDWVATSTTTVDIVLISAASLTVNGNIPVPSSQLEQRNTGKRTYLEGGKLLLRKAWINRFDIKSAVNIGERNLVFWGNLSFTPGTKRNQYSVG